MNVCHLKGWWLQIIFSGWICIDHCRTRLRAGLVDSDFILLNKCAKDITGRKYYWINPFHSLHIHVNWNSHSKIDKFVHQSFFFYLDICSHCHKWIELWCSLMWYFRSICVKHQAIWVSNLCLNLRTVSCYSCLHRCEVRPHKLDQPVNFPSLHCPKCNLFLIVSNWKTTNPNSFIKLSSRTKALHYWMNWKISVISGFKMAS